MKLIFFGTQDWSAHYLEALLDDGFFEIVGVITQPDKPVGRKHELSASPVKEVAVRKNLLVLQPVSWKDPAFLETIRSLAPEIGVVIAYGKLIPQSIIDAVPLGLINVHPSLLPRWRGPSPVAAAIASGDQESGITIMKIDAQMDHGPILSQQIMKMDPEETTLSFMQKVNELGASFFVTTLKAYANGDLKPQEQTHEEATYCAMLSKDDGHLDWRKSAQAIERQIRAYHPWPGTWTTVIVQDKKIRLKILRGRAESNTYDHQPGTLFASQNRLFIACADGALHVEIIQPEGRAPMPASAFLAGYTMLLESSLDLPETAEHREEKAA